MRVVGLFFLAWANLFADVAVVSPNPMDTSIWGDPSSYPSDGDGLVGWAYAHFHLMKKGEEFFSTDLQDKDLPRLQAPSTSVLIVNNIPSWTRRDWKGVLAKIPARKLLICCAPPTVMPQMYHKAIYDLFDVVLTWNSDLVDNKKFFQFCCPCLLSIGRDVLPFEKKSLLTQISGNKTSKHLHGTYSLRKKAIKYFERHTHKDFCFYGKKRGLKHFRNYGGPIDDEKSFLQRYRFCLCFEDMKHVRGYVTEKFFDCFRAQCVPVYIGASDIKKLVSRECYIRWKDFKSFKKLYAYLEKMPKETYLKYVNCAQKFMKSRRASRFTQESFGKVLLKAILQTKISKKKHYIFKK